MIFFFGLWIQAALLLFSFGLLGLCIVEPFSALLPFSYLFSPFAGMMLLPFLTNMIYSTIDLSYAKCICLALLPIVFAVAIQSKSVDWKKAVVQLVAFSIIGSIIGILLCDSRSLQLGEPAIFFKYGSDHAGYGQMADWLLHFRATQRAINDGGAWPYQSYPDYLFDSDPRFGSFGLLATISLLTSIDGLFSYPIAISLLLVSSAIGCAAICSKRISILILCFLCLIFSQSIDYGFNGFLGRSFAYPASALLAGVLIQASFGDKNRLLSVFALEAAIATAYPGFVIGILAASIVLIWLLMCRLASDRSLEIPNLGTMLMALCVPTVSSGVAARPIGFTDLPKGPKLSVVLSEVFDIEDRVTPMTGLASHTVFLLMIAATVLAMLLLVVACYRKDFLAVGYIFGPLLFITFLMVIGRSSTAREFSGFVYVANVIGACLLLNENRKLITTAAVCLILLLGVSIRTPRLYNVITKFGYQYDPDYTITKQEFDNLKSQIGEKTMEINTGTDVGRGLWALTELGIDPDHSFLVPETWHAMLAYRLDWSYKAPRSVPDLTLKLDLRNDVHHHFKIESNN